jgi:serine protease
MTLRKIRRKTLIAAAIGSAVTLMTTSTMANANADEARYIVKFKEDGISTSKHERKDKNTKRLAKHQAKMILHLNRSNSAAVKLNKQQLAAMRNDADVAFVEIDPVRYLIDTVTRSFDGVSTQAITPAAESAPYGIALVQADQVSDSPTSNMKVCITDTGYDGNHVDLRPYTDSGVTGDNDDGLGNNTGNWWEPGHSHGTHVAGTIGALGNNGTGVIGVNPSGLLDLHIVKIFNNAGSWGYGSDLVKAVEQCRDAGANVISMSIGGGASSTTEENAFIAAANAGLINIAAAGNDGNTAHSYPASYDSVMSVAALDSNKNIASFSQRTNQVEIAAPGVAVNSTIIGNSYASWDGTSMATPHVSGVAALVWSHFPSCTGNDIRQAMTATAQDLGSAGRDNTYGYGLVQAKAMYDGLVTNGCGGVTPPPPPPPPVAGILENGVAHTGLSGGTSEQANFTMTVPAGATDISFNMSGGTGDADLYVRFGAAPTTSTYDCRPYATGNNESCAGISDDGVYHVMINGYSAYSGTSLVGNYTDGGTPPPPPPPPTDESYTNDSNISLKDRKTKTSFVDVTGSGDSGTITVDVDIKHTYVGQLKITLVSPSGAKSVLREYTGGSADNILETYSVNASGLERNGQWLLQVRDSTRGDKGYIDSWTINF